MKEPVRIQADPSPRYYRDLEEPAGGEIELVLNGWGYGEARLIPEGDFISMEVQSVTDRDFTDNRCRVPYRILSQALHGGKNFGRIRIKTLRQEFVIPIEAEGKRRGDPYS